MIFKSVDKLRVIIFSFILIWASISVAFIVQDIYSGPERSISKSPGNVNVTTVYFPNSSYGLNIFTVIEALFLIWIISAALALIFYFKQSIKIIVNLLLSTLGVLILIGFAFIVSWLVVFNYPKNSILISLSFESLAGTVPIILPFLILLLVIIYFALRFVPRTISEKNENLGKSIEMVIGELKFSNDIKGAIMKAYYDLSRILKNHGVIEEEYLTPREFENMTLRKLKIDSTPFERIVELFEEARYSEHPLSENHRKMAIESLEKIKSILGD